MTDNHFQHDTSEHVAETSTNPPAWKDELKNKLLDWVDALPEDAQEPSPISSNHSDTLPDLEQFWRALIALESHTRRHVKKSAASLDALTSEIQQMKDAINTESPSWENVRVALSFADFSAQLTRMGDSLSAPPPALPFGLSHKWQEAWEHLQAGNAILLRNLQSLLATIGIENRFPSSGCEFDPTWMEAVEFVAVTGEDEGHVEFVFEPAYFLNSKPIRSARVRVIR